MNADRLAEIRLTREAGDYQRAANLAREAIAATEMELGHRALELAVLLNELGMIGKFRGTFHEAEQAYSRALAIYRVHGETVSSNIAALLHNLGGLAHAKGDLEAAESFARRGIVVREALERPNPQALAEDRGALAAILIDLNRLHDAEPILREVLRDYRTAYGLAHYEIAATLHNLGSLQFRLGRWVRGARMLRKARDMKITVLGDRHPDIAITLHNLAYCELKINDFESAALHLGRAIEILVPVVDEKHPTLISCRTKLAQVPQAHQDPPIR